MKKNLKLQNCRSRLVIECSYKDPFHPVSYVKNIIFLNRDCVQYRSIYNEFLEFLNDLKCKNSKLQSCRSRRGLEFLYKDHLNPTSYKKDTIFHIKIISIRRRMKMI